MEDRPIGIFDSGIGGLTVASELHRVLPKESILYFGDTAHLPYGDKSAETIVAYSKGITKLLMENGCKAILIACNSASATAHDAVSILVGNDIPVFNVIDPVVEHVAHWFTTAKVGIIGTRATITSDVYRKRLIERSPGVKVVQKSTSLLAPMIEEGFHDDSISNAVIHAYLEEHRFNGIKALIPACTHYPMIADEIQNYLGTQVELINAPRIVAEDIQSKLEQLGLLSNSNDSKLRFLVSDLTPSFQKSSAIFFGEKVELEEHRQST
ncbi:MAG: glutamate racemase [Flavobacteriales bacterium]|nr:glutamate racemase [Flavobacteriales bacterium]